MIGISVSRRYAKALVALLDTAEELEEVRRQLGEYEALIGSSTELRAILYNPTVAMPVKHGIQQQLLERLQALPIIRQFLNLLLEKNRLRFLGTILKIYADLMNERLNRVHAKVTTRYPLPPASAEQMRQRLAQATGKEVIIEAEVDEQMLGGVVTQIGGLVLDGSVRTHLRTIREELARSTS